MNQHFGSGIGRTFIETFPPIDAEIRTIASEALEKAPDVEDPIRKFRSAIESSGT